MSPLSPSDSGSIVVAPSSLGGASAAVSLLSGDVRSQALSSLGSRGAEVIGDAQCFAALTTASHLVGEALESSRRSLDELAHALRSAAEAYGLADALAFVLEQP